MNCANYLANQMNGPVAKSLLQAAYEMRDRYADIVSHYKNWTPLTASTEDLENLGVLFNAPRPYAEQTTDRDFEVSDGLPAENMDYPVEGKPWQGRRVNAWSLRHGLGVEPEDLKYIVNDDGTVSLNVSTTTRYGELIDVNRVLGTVPVSDDMYAQYLVQLQYIRRTHSLNSIWEALYAMFGAEQGFSVGFITNAMYLNDIHVQLAERYRKYADFLQTAFDYEFNTSPRVFVSISAEL